MSKRKFLATTLAVPALILGVMVAAQRNGGRLDERHAAESPLRSYATSGGMADAPGPSAYPSEWAWIRRTAPYWNADAQAFRQEVDRAQSLKKAAGLGHRFALTPVSPRGSGQHRRALQRHRVASDGRRRRLRPATGGVYKSSDGGTSWTPIADALPNLNVGDLAIDPTQPQTIWLGTGEPNGGHNNFPGGGVYRSTDAGATWSFMGLDRTASIGRVVVDPTDGQRVFVAAQGSYFGPNPERGLYRTTDGGASWQLVLSVNDSTGATDIVIDPSNPSRLLAATWERVRRPNGGTHLFRAVVRHLAQPQRRRHVDKAGSDQRSTQSRHAERRPHRTGTVRR